MVLAGIHLLVHPGTLATGRIVSLCVSTDPDIRGPIPKRSLRLTPFVKFGPDNVTLQKPVTLTVPHCAFTSSDQRGLDVYSGVLHTDQSVQWTLEEKLLRCTMKSLHFEVESQKPCLIGLHIPHKSKLIKRVRVVPIVNRITNLGDDLIIRLWIHNDHELEHQCNQVGMWSKVTDITSRRVVLSMKKFTIERAFNFIILFLSNSNLWIRLYLSVLPAVRPGVAHIPEKWHKVVFHLQNKGMKDTVNLEIDARYATTNKVLFQINIELKIGNLLRKDQATSPFQRVLPETMQRAFSHLKHNLSQDLNADQCTQLATIFHLHDEAISNIQKHRTPGRLLLDKLTQTSMISPANISTLENFLTEQGIEECARHVRDYRKNNPIVDAIMCPEVGFS
ncbi:hypothetical protein BSL78_08489 [Apostichopus japonicus]|uniref:ZU5 domain-containing protein n=1 Tax=Stichopus japonicus TaxID=307972 RepID=A0A2G8L375_STIJA|nr:hypothetical protein BSL78_08489 [Apostichopus japonicus]